MGRAKTGRPSGRPPTGRKTGGHYCSAVGCSNCTARDRKRGIQFYKFPKDKKRCKEWMLKVKRIGPRGALWIPHKTSRICSEHFYGGLKSDDPSSTSYLPTLFSTGHVPVASQADIARLDRRQRRGHMSGHHGKRDMTSHVESVHFDDIEEQDMTENNSELEDVETDMRSHNDSVHVATKEDNLSNHVESAHEATEKVSEFENEAVQIAAEIFKPPKIHQQQQTPKWMFSCLDVEGKSQYEFGGFLASHSEPDMKFECHYLSANEKCTAIMTKYEKNTKMKTVGTLTKPETKDATTNISWKYLTILELRDNQFSGYTGVSKQMFNFFLYRIGENLKDSLPISREYKLILVLVKLKLDVTFVVLASMFDIRQHGAKAWFDEAFWALHSATKDLVIWLSKSTIQARMPAAFKESFPGTRCIIDASEVECSRPQTPKARVQMYSSYKSRWTYKFLLGCAPSGEITFISKSFGGRTTDSELTVKSGFIKLIEVGDTILADKGFPTIEAKLNESGGILVMPPFKAGQKSFQFTRRENQECYKIARVRVHVERAIGRLKNFKCFDFVRADMGEYFDASLIIVSAICNCLTDLIKE